jgi:Ca2+-binding EF-hand superfamily protein
MQRIFTPKTLGAVAAVALTAAGLSSAAYAQAAPPPAPMFDFAAMDTDKDGTLTKAEMQAHHAAQMVLLDTDKDGFLSASEIAAHHQAGMAGRAEKRAARMIKRLDSDGDGALSLAEAQLGPNDRMFSRMDDNEDGVISAEEAAKMASGKDGRGGHHGGSGYGTQHESPEVLAGGGLVFHRELLFLRSLLRNAIPLSPQHRHITDMHQCRPHGYS